MIFVCCDRCGALMDSNRLLQQSVGPLVDLCPECQAELDERIRKTKAEFIAERPSRRNPLEGAEKS